MENYVILHTERNLAILAIGISEYGADTTWYLQGYHTGYPFRDLAVRDPLQLAKYTTRVPFF